MPELRISPYDVTVAVRDGDTMLAAILRSGRTYRYGCRRGGCGICKVHLVYGEVEYERPIDRRVLTDDERVSGICLSCRAVPLTNVVIELQEGDRLRTVNPYATARDSTRPESTSQGPAKPDEIPDKVVPDKVVAERNVTWAS